MKTTLAKQYLIGRVSIVDGMSPNGPSILCNLWFGTLYKHVKYALICSNNIHILQSAKFTHRRQFGSTPVTSGYTFFVIMTRPSEL